jgi:hypothetical protein
VTRSDAGGRQSERRDRDGRSHRFLVAADVALKLDAGTNDGIGKPVYCDAASRTPFLDKRG